MNKHIEKAKHDAQFLQDDLKAAYSVSDPILSILVYDLLEKVAPILNRIKEIQGVM